MKKRAVIDTNVVLSGFLSSKGSPAKILDAWMEKHFISIMSFPLEKEYFAVLEYSKIKDRLGSNLFRKAKETLTDIVRMAEHVDIKDKISFFKDTDDDILIETAISGEAHYIVSGDKAVLSAKNYKIVKIITATEFIEIL